MIRLQHGNNEHFPLPAQLVQGHRGVLWGEGSGLGPGMCRDFSRIRKLSSAARTDHWEQRSWSLAYSRLISHADISSFRSLGFLGLMLDGSRFSRPVWTGNLELVSFDSVPKIFLDSRVDGRSGQHFLGLTRTLEQAQAALAAPRIYLSHRKKQVVEAGVGKKQPKMCSFNVFCVTVHGLAGTCVQRQGVVTFVSPRVTCCDFA